ncbi:protein split ends isoform X2 [Drosophila suzukii]|uniref:Protein split ends isoform X2 n=1 Tax=Drosophila suzukii TaxID=28584 RepID=A0AB40DDW4_DROSZ
MRPFLLLALILALANCEQRPLVFTNWPPKSAKQLSRPAAVGSSGGAGPPGKQRTLVVQIRSDQPVPLVLKGRPGHGPHTHAHAHTHAAHLAHPHSVHPHVLSHAHSHAHLHSHPMIHVPQHQYQHLRGPPRPIKMGGPSPVYLKPSGALRKPLKIKLNNVKPKAKPTFGKPFKYETPSAVSYSELQNLPKLFAPDPDPSLPTTKIRPATESFNTPSNNKPLPADVQSNHLPAQPLVQIVGAQAAAQTAPEIYPIQYAQPAVQSQSFIAAIPAAHIPIYNPTYLVTQSNQLYSAHKQQLFKPSAEPVVESGYVNADLTQEVASNGQILQAAKDPHHNIHPVLDSAPQYAALIAAPALGDHGESAYETASFHLPNVASAVTASVPEGGFVVSNFYGHAHDSSQLLQAYAEEEARRQQLETEHAAIELQKQQQLHLEELKAQAQEQQQQHQFHLEELRAQAQYQQQQQQQFEELQAQAQEQHLQQQHQQQQLQLLQLQQQHQQLQQPVQHHPQQQQVQHQQQQQVQHQQQQQLQHQQQQQLQHQQQEQVAQDPAASAFEEHQRLVQQQLGANTPLRIFVPDEEASESRLQKRSDDLKKGTVEDVPSAGLIESDSEESAKDLFEVSTSVEVAGEHLTASSN